MLSVVTDTTIGTLGANTAGSTGYSTIVNMKNMDTASDFCVLVATTTPYTSSAIVITQQCSKDGITWYDPVSAYNVSVGAVFSQTADAVAQTRFIQVTPVLAPYVRYKAVSQSEATVTLSFMFMEA